jgi:hypothetical protein
MFYFEFDFSPPCEYRSFRSLASRMLILFCFDNVISVHVFFFLDFEFDGWFVCEALFNRS